MSMHSRKTKRKLEELKERLEGIREEYKELDTDIIICDPEITATMEELIMYINYEADSL